VLYLGKILNLITQKFLPPTKKSVLIKFRKPNGAWTEIMLPPTQSSFKIKGNDTVYYLKDTPDIDDSTNQRMYTFLSGIPYPIDMHSQHPSLSNEFNKQGNLAMMLTEADQQGYDRAALLKKKPKFDVQLWTFIVSAITLLICLGIAAMVSGVGAV
jgi:hypothetical protein